MQTKIRFLTYMALASLTLVAAHASESDSLDGIELEYTYTDGAAVVLNFYDGLVKYRWIAGPYEGSAGEGFQYNAKPMGEDRYMVVWRSAKDRFFVTMVIDLEQRTMVTSAISGYATDQEMVLFDEATIQRVER